MLNFDDPFEYKLIAKKHGDLMITLAQKGKSKDQIRRIIIQREQQEEGRTFDQPIYEVGDHLLIITADLKPFVGIVHGINVESREYSMSFDGLPETHMKEAIVPEMYIMCKVDAPIKK
jgi:hypothetical protein